MLITCFSTMSRPGVTVIKSFLEKVITVIVYTIVLTGLFKLGKV